MGDRVLKIMRRFRSRGGGFGESGHWRGISDIASAVGAPKDAVRGLLIGMIPTGQIEVAECSNGVFFRAAGDQP